MREITNYTPATLKITADDAAGHGGANHVYTIAARANEHQGPLFSTTIAFQNGPIGEFSVNGLTNEALLAVVIDRLQGFQRGGYSCRENALALTKLEEAQHWLAHRTFERAARGVEGTSKV